MGSWISMDQVADTVHKAAVGHLPSFITPPGQSDVLLNIVIVFLICVVFLTGVLYLRLHALPEQIAHRTHKVQIQLVAVLGLISLFTHNQLFWIAALLIAMAELPDFLSPITSMARSLRIIVRHGLPLPPAPVTPTGTPPSQETAQVIPAAPDETNEKKQEQE
jgi:hypothetical protein